MSKRVKSRAQELRKRKPSKAYEQGFGQNGGVSSLGTTYEDTDSDGVLDTIVKNSPRIGAFKRTVGVVSRPYLPQPAPVGPPDNPPVVSAPLNDMTATGTVTLSNHFTDVDGDLITYVVSSSDATVATVAEAGGTLTVTEGTVYGTATITVTATANGKSVTGTFDFIYSFTSTQSLRFDALNTHATAGGNFGGNVVFNPTITIEGLSIWFKPATAYQQDATNSGATTAFLCGFGGSDTGISLGGKLFTQMSNSLITVFSNNQGWAYNSAAALDVTQWYHLAIRWEPLNSATNPGNPGYDIFLNGIRVGDDFGTYPPAKVGNRIVADRATVGAKHRGNDFPGGRRFQGLIDEFTLFNSPISEADIVTMYNGGMGPVDMAPLNPALWWRMGEGAAWDGANWTIPDETAVFPALGNPAVTSNIAQADVVTDVP